MNLKNYFATIACGLWIGLNPLSQSVSASTSRNIAGIVISSESKEKLKKATVKVYFKNSLEKIVDSLQTFTNDNGEFQFILPKQYKEFDLSFSHIGYKTKSIFNSSFKDSKRRPIQLEQKIVEIGGISVSPKKLHKIATSNKKTEVIFDENLNEFLDKNYVEFVLNDIQTALKKEALSINPQSKQLSSTLNIQGYAAPVFLDKIPLLNSSKFGALGSTSMYTFSKVGVYESRTKEGGSPGSIQIFSRNRPEKSKTSKIYCNPIIKEFYTEKKLGDSAFIFTDFFSIDNSLLKLFPTELRAPNYKTLETKLSYWQNKGVREASIYFIGSLGKIGGETNAPKVVSTSKDYTLIFNLESQLDSFFGLNYPLFYLTGSTQNSDLTVKNPSKTLDIKLNRTQKNFLFGSTFFLPWANLNTQFSFQKNYVELKGNMLEDFEVGDGGENFSQSFEELMLGNHEDIFSSYVGLQKEKIDVNAEYKNFSGNDLFSFWINKKINFFQNPLVFGAGYVQDFPSNKDFLENRYVISKEAKIKKERVIYINLKGVKKLKNGIFFEVGAYKNWSRINSLREPDFQDIFGEDVSMENIQTLIEQIKDDPLKLVPEPTFHLLNGGRWGLRFRAKIPKIKSVKLTGDVCFEESYTYIPDRAYLQSINNSPHIKDYTSIKIKNPTSSGLRTRLELDFDLSEAFDFSNQLNAKAVFNYSQGRPFLEEKLNFINAQNNEEYSQTRGEEENLYLKQTDFSNSSRFPPSFDLDISLSYNPKPNLRIFLFADNILDSKRILNKVYNEKYKILSNGNFWEDKDNFRFVGVGFESRF